MTFSCSNKTNIIVCELVILVSVMAINSTDDELVAAFLQGEADAFTHIFDRYEGRVFGFILSLGGKWHHAEDVAQVTWMKVLDGLENYQPCGKFRSWVFRVAYHEWLNLVNSAWERRHTGLGLGSEEDFRTVPVDLEGMKSLRTPHDESVASEERMRLFQAMDELPGLMKQTLLLRLSGGMTFKEVSEAMDCPLGTALWRAKEAEKRLKKILGEV